MGASRLPSRAGRASDRTGVGFRTSSTSFLDDVLGRSTPGGPGGGQPSGDGAPRDRQRATSAVEPADPDPVDPVENETGMSAAERRRQILQERQGLRIDTEAMKEDRPEFDRSDARLNKVVTGAGAVAGLLGALGGSEVAARAGQGLAAGGAENLRRQREGFRRRRETFRERLQQAEQFNREVSLSVSEGRAQAAGQQAQRAFQEEQAEEQRAFQRGQAERQAERQATRDERQAEAQRRLVRLRDRLEDNDNLSDLEKEKMRKEIDLIDARIGAREALESKRNRANTGEGGGGSGLQAEAAEQFGNLSDSEVEALLQRGSQLVESGKPPAADFDNSGTVTEAEMNRFLGTGNSPPSQSDISRVSERVNLLRAEAARRGLIETEGNAGSGAGTEAPGDSTETTVPRSARDTTGSAGDSGGQPFELGEPDADEIQAARSLVRNGQMTEREFRRLYPNADLER